jgi:hypothetical protein
VPAGFAQLLLDGGAQPTDGKPSGGTAFMAIVDSIEACRERAS